MNIWERLKRLFGAEPAVDGGTRHRKQRRESNQRMLADDSFDRCEPSPLPSGQRLESDTGRRQVAESEADDRANARPVTSDAPIARSVTSTSRNASAQQLGRQRRRLIEACIEVGEQVDSRMLREQLSDALEDAGVIAYDPSGERFDPDRHESVGRMPTDDPALEGVVGVVQRPGYRDGDDTIRLPEVLVWRHERGQTSGS